MLNENGESVDTLYYGDIISLKFYRYIRNADGTVSEEYYKHSDEMNNVSFKNQIGTHSIPFEIEGKQTVLNFTLKKRPVEIGLSGTEKLYSGEVEGKLPQVTAFTELAAGDKLEDLVVWAYISAENKMIIGDDLDKITDGMIINEINNETPSGSYYAIIIPNPNEDSLSEYYDIKINSSEFTIYPKRYVLNISAEKCDVNEAGEIHMTIPETKTIGSETLRYESGTAVKLTAVSYSGYIFDHWNVNGTEYKADTVSFTMSASENNVKACFKKDDTPLKQGEIFVDEEFLLDGSIKYPVDFDNSKTYPVGKEFTFSAIDSENAVFDYWNKIVGRKSYNIYTRDITVTVSESPITLYPVFKGAPCKVTLGSGIKAEFETVNEDEETVINSVSSGDTVPKGTELKLNALNVNSEYSWYINGQKLNQSQSDLKFTVTDDVKIEYKSTIDDNKFSIEMYAHSITLDGSIILNFYVDIKNYDNRKLNAKMFSTHFDNSLNKETTVEIGTFEIKDGTTSRLNEGRDKYHFSVPLAAAMINDSITMEVYDEGSDKPILTDVYSISEYAYSKIASSSDQKLVKTLISLLDYGTQAQKYFDYNNIESNYAAKSLTSEQLASAKDGITDYISALEQTDAIDRNVVNNTLNENNIALVYTGSTLQLDAGLKLRYYFKSQTGTAEDALAAYGDLIHFTDSSINFVTGIEGDEIYIETEQLPYVLITDLYNYNLAFGEKVVIDNATISSYFKSIYAKDDNDAKRVQLKRVNESLYYFAENIRLYSDK